MGCEHSHSHHHHHHAPTEWNKVFILAVIGNATFTVFEALYAFVAHSMGLLADAGHNFGDVLSLLMAWGANWLLTKPATQKRSYGYKKTTIVAALTNSLFLIAATAVIAYESFHRLMHPVSINEKIVMLVAFMGIFVNGGTAMLFMRGQNEDLNIKSAYMHLASDALISAGVVLSGAIIFFTHAFWVDPLVGLLIVLAILFGTWQLLRDSLNLILDAVPSHIDHHGVKNYLTQLPNVNAVHDLHIWGLSTREVALTAHLIMPEKNLSDHDYHEIHEHLKNHFHIHHVTLQIERGDGEHGCHQKASC